MKRVDIRRRANNHENKLDGSSNEKVCVNDVRVGGLWRKRKGKRQPARDVAQTR